MAGVRVVDASQMLAGPICAMRLGDLGADVLKVEPPRRGEHNRSHGFGALRIAGETPTYLALNRNKRGVALDLKRPAGLAVLHELVRASDVFIQNYRVGTAERLGVSWEQLHAVNPRLIYCQISGYGEHGPYRDRPGQDLLVQGYSGSMWSVGCRDDPPLPGALWAVDVLTGFQAAIGILAALAARGCDGEGQKVEVNMLAVAMDCQAQELTAYLNGGLQPERTATSSAHALIPAPYGVFRTADGWLTVAMCPLPALGEVLDDERLQAMTGEDDPTHRRDDIHAIVGAALQQRTTDQWIRLFDAHGLWAGPVYRYEDLVADPHVREAGLIIELEHPIAGTLRLTAPPLHLSVTDTVVRRPPPRLGEHTAEVLADLLGYDAGKIAALEAEGAIGLGGGRS